MQIFELTHKQSEISQLDEGLWNTVKALASRDPKLAGMSLKAKSQYMATNKAVDKIAEKGVDAWSTYVATKLRQDPNFLNNPQAYKRDLRLFVQKNMLPPYTTIDQMTNRAELYQALDQIVANRVDTQGRPSPQAQQQAFNKLVDLASVAMVNQQQQPGRAPRGTTGMAPRSPAQIPQGTTQFTPQAAQAFMQNFGMSAQQLGMLSNALKQVAGSNTISSTGNPAIDNLLKGLGFNIT